MKTVDELKVGDTVWWTDVNRPGMHTGQVGKVGRKLVTVQGYTFRKDTFRTNDGYSHQTLVIDLDAFEERQKVVKVISQIARAYGGSRDISLADALEAARLLRVELE